MPTALPIMADSDNGVSKTRCSPNCCCRCSVTRKTPPLAPMSCPNTTTFVSRSSSWAMPLFKASIIVICILHLSFCVRLYRLHIAQEVFSLLLQARRQGFCGVIKETIRGHWRELLRGPHCLVHLIFHVVYNLFRSLLGQQVTLYEEALETSDGVFDAPRLDLFRVAIACRVIGGGMRSHTIGERLYECRPLPFACVLN